MIYGKLSNPRVLKRPPGDQRAKIRFALWRFLCFLRSMPAAEKTLVYLILGAAGSGRREVIVDLIADGLAETDRPSVMLPADEPLHEADQQLPPGPRWRWENPPAGFVAAELPRTASPVFFVTDGRRNPVDQIEAFKAWLDTQGGQLARIICVVDCQLASQHPSLLAWYDACIHFSDVALLNHREGVENKWLSDFLLHFKKQHLPCVFETVKAGRVKNPALILEPEARRMSQVFDEEQDWIFKNADGEVIDEMEEGDDDDEEIEATPIEDPYLARRLGGRRVKEFPDIATFLGKIRPQAEPSTGNPR